MLLWLFLENMMDTHMHTLTHAWAQKSDTLAPTPALSFYLCPCSSLSVSLIDFCFLTFHFNLLFIYFLFPPSIIHPSLLLWFHSIWLWWCLIRLLIWRKGRLLPCAVNRFLRAVSTHMHPHPTPHMHTYFPPSTVWAHCTCLLALTSPNEHRLKKYEWSPSLSVYVCVRGYLCVCVCV